MNIQEFQLKKILPIATMGFVVGAIELPVLISFGVLIYSGDLAQYSSIGIGMTLFSAIIFQLTMAFASSSSGSIGGPQDSPAAILAVAGATVSAAMIGASIQARFATVVAMIFITTLSTGLIFLLLGTFKLSRFVRFVPYPVVGGFIAGTGLLLIRGSFNVMLDASIGIANLGVLLTPEALIRWLPGVIFGLALALITRRSNHILITPAMLTLGVTLFYIYLFITGTSLGTARELGWVLGPFSEGTLWKPMDMALLQGVDWSMLAGQASSIGAVIMISVVALLLNASAIELVSMEDIDMNRELVSAGIGNLLGAFTGGSAGYHYLSLSALPMRSGIRSRLVGVFLVLILAVVLIFGATLLSLIPKYMVGGLLFFVGLSFLAEWVYDAWFNLPKLEYVLVLVIIAVVGWAGFLQGVAVGILAAVILFVVNYSRIDIVNHALTGLTYRSRVDRPMEHHKLLDGKGDQITILQLNGFIFFGTAQGLLGRVRSRIADKSQPALRYLVLDFRRVSALDSSAVFSFIRIQQMADANGIHMFLTEVPQSILTTLKTGGVNMETVRTFPSMDEAVGTCEDKIIKSEDSSAMGYAKLLNSRLKQAFSSKEQVDKFLHYLDRVEIEAEQVLIRQGEQPAAMFFVEAGELAAILEIPPDKILRLRTMGPGSTVGEIGMYLRIPPTATVVASVKSVVHKLSVESLEKMEIENPALASGLHRWIVLTLSQRLSENNRTLEALLN